MGTSVLTLLLHSWTVWAYSLNLSIHKANGYVPRAQADYPAGWGLEDSETGEVPGH